jgi:hypothetical protein
MRPNTFRLANTYIFGRLTKLDQALGHLLRGLLSPRNARFCGKNAGENNLASGQSGFILNTLFAFN